MLSWFFFSISGFLVTQSWLSDPNAFRFAWRRILRIWPALITVVLLSTLILGPIVTNLTVFDYFAHRATWDYLRTLIMEIHFPLPGVFTNNPGGSSVNGSLWTIPFEVRCYLFMAIIGITGLLKNKKWIIAWCIIFFAWYINKGIPDIVGKYIPGREFSAYFIMGVILQCTQKFWTPYIKSFIFISFLIGITLYINGYHFLALLISVPALTIGLGKESTPVLNKFGRFGDPSYGIYLYAYPVQQTMLNFFYPTLNFYISMLFSAVITVTLAYISWQIIEKSALRLKPKKISTQRLQYSQT
ncbi:acyltransferase family protein [Comamonas sp. J-3]